VRRITALVAVTAALVMLTAAPADASTTWTVQYPPNPASSINSSLEGVSCPGSATCISVGGYYVPSNNTDLSLAEEWNGASWAIQSTPNPAGASGTGFSGVSCPTTTLCIAVGGYNTNPTALDKTLAEKWNGTKWSIQKTPALTRGGDLDAVSCPSTTDCIAVGDSFTANNTDGLAEGWNGSTWSVQSIPNPASGGAYTAVSCPSTSWCMATGGNNNGGPAAAVWNGSTWSSVAFPSPSGEPLSGPASVSCSSATACTATGSGITSSDGYQIVAARWNGTKWTLQSAPDPGPDAQLVAVACPSASSCTAIGDSGGVSGVTLAEGWNGSKWTIESAPDPSGYSFPEAIACTAVTACVSTGEYFPADGGTTDTLAYRYSS
jgi:hypothetical protein